MSDCCSPCGPTLGAGMSHLLSEHPGEGMGVSSPLFDPSRAESKRTFCFPGLSGPLTLQDDRQDGGCKASRGEACIEES